MSRRGGFNRRGEQKGGVRIVKKQSAVKPAAPFEGTVAKASWGVKGLRTFTSHVHDGKGGQVLTYVTHQILLTGRKILPDVWTTSTPQDFAAFLASSTMPTSEQSLADAAQAEYVNFLHDNRLTRSKTDKSGFVHFEEIVDPKSKKKTRSIIDKVVDQAVADKAESLAALLSGARTTLARTLPVPVTTITGTQQTVWHVGEIRNAYEFSAVTLFGRRTEFEADVDHIIQQTFGQLKDDSSSEAADDGDEREAKLPPVPDKPSPAAKAVDDKPTTDTE